MWVWRGEKTGRGSDYVRPVLLMLTAGGLMRTAQTGWLFHAFGAAVGVPFVFGVAVGEDSEGGG